MTNPNDSTGVARLAAGLDDLTEQPDHGDDPAGATDLADALSRWATTRNQNNQTQENNR